MLSPNKPNISGAPLSRFRSHGFSGPQIGILFAALTLLGSMRFDEHRSSELGTKFV